MIAVEFKGQLHRIVGGSGRYDDKEDLAILLLDAFKTESALRCDPYQRFILSAEYVPFQKASFPVLTTSGSNVSLFRIHVWVFLRRYQPPWNQIWPDLYFHKLILEWGHTVKSQRFWTIPISTKRITAHEMDAIAPSQPSSPTMPRQDPWKLNWPRLLIQDLKNSRNMQVLWIVVANGVCGTIGIERPKEEREGSNTWQRSAGEV